MRFSSAAGVAEEFLNKRANSVVRSRLIFVSPIMNRISHKSYCPVAGAAAIVLRGRHARPCEPRRFRAAPTRMTYGTIPSGGKFKRCHGYVRQVST